MPPEKVQSHLLKHVNTTTCWTAASVISIRALIQGRSAGRRHQRVVLGTYPTTWGRKSLWALPPSQAWATTLGWP